MKIRNFKPLEKADYEKLESELVEYGMNISSDPSVDIGQFLSQLHEVNSYTQRVGTMELVALKNEHFYNEALQAAKSARDRAYNRILNDESKGIQKKSNQSLRDAATAAFIEKEETDLLNATFLFERAKLHRVLIQKRLERLKDAGDKISRQITVVDYMIALGILRGGDTE